MSKIIEAARTLNKQDVVDDPVAYLEVVLQKIPSGSIIGEQESEVVNALAAAWSSLPGHEEQSTWSSKVHRAEKLNWEPPVLKFILERHGATVNGSSRADLHHWEVNVQTGYATIRRIGKRQLEPMSRPLNVGPIAEKVADAIVNHQKNDWLVWKRVSFVQVRISLIIPETNLQTTTARRKRFRKALTEMLKPAGWNEVRPNFYERTYSPSRQT